ncbi:MAG: hypothetical protein ABSG53_07545 [Thermoguttaceae bacterium]|jgi:hypothetical protein
MKDFLEQLADVEVCEPPADFNWRLHQRVNRTLLIQHVVDFLVGAIAWSAPHFFRAALGWLLLTITGKFPDRNRR